MQTTVVKVRGDASLGRWAEARTPTDTNGGENASTTLWEIPDSADTAAQEALAPLRKAAQLLRTSDVPVAFPTETVYGLGADATRSGAVKGIYHAKGRPSDNPLIIHVCDLTMLRKFLTPATTSTTTAETEQPEGSEDPIPPIYRPLLERFWPGPLTILLPNPQPSRLAPEVTAGLPTFGCRMPASALARTLIRLVDAPLAAPSANASTRPSPTAAGHVLHDLDGRIELILDGGPCTVGVESTVVDGLSDPPAVLRPGGVTIEELRKVSGWERVQNAYKDHGVMDKSEKPRAPGMKYKHYSPKAKVVLYEAGFVEGREGVLAHDLQEALAGLQHVENGGQVEKKTIGVVRTRRWPVAGGLKCVNVSENGVKATSDGDGDGDGETTYSVQEGDLAVEDAAVGVFDIDLGPEVKGVAQGLFSALRDLDSRGAEIIFIEGVDDGDDIAAAVMNRLRKAASDIRA